MPRAGLSSGGGVSGYLKVKQQTYRDLDKASGEPVTPVPPPAPTPITKKPEPKQSTITSILRRMLEK
jgi:hypothetical protein